MSQGNQQRQQQASTQGTKTVEAATEVPEDTLAKARADIESTRGLMLQLAITTLKVAKAYCQCRNCKRVASRFLGANHRDFGTQDVPLCDGCQLNTEWKSTGMVRQITDTNLVETIRIANEIICSRKD